MCLFPFVSNLFAQWDAAQKVERAQAEALKLDPELKAQLLLQATSYNDLKGGLTPALAPEEIWPYDRQLVNDAYPYMAWLEVPKAAIKINVYHGVDDDALAAGVGHQSESSLPVGGERSKVVLSGHSGLKRARIFDGIRALEPGDVLALHVLGDVYAYRVFDWKILNPEDVDMQPEDGDIVYLVTCTTSPDPFNPKGRIGINDKRLVVMAKRCPYDAAEFENTKPDISVYVNDNYLPLMLSAALCSALVVIGIVRRAIKKRNQAKHMG